MRKELIERLRDATEGPRMLMNEAATMLEADAPAVPQEPVRNDMSIQLLERLIKTLTNLGYATPEGGIEAFNADLPTQLYHLCFGVDRVLSALKTAVPQEPVAWQYRGRPAVNREWGEWHTVGHKPKGPECTRFMMRPLFASPQQQPRLTDEEIAAVAKVTESAEPGRDGYILPFSFARAIEKKVRGEA